LNAAADALSKAGPAFQEDAELPAPARAVQKGPVFLPNTTARASEQARAKLCGDHRGKGHRGGAQTVQ